MRTKLMTRHLHVRRAWSFAGHGSKITKALLRQTKRDARLGSVLIFQPSMAADPSRLFQFGA